jgi:hypothetical protein
MSLKHESGEVEESLRRFFGDVLSYAEVTAYSALGLLLLGGALVGLASAGALLTAAVKDWKGIDSVFLLIDRLLFVLMLVEILHTVRISLRWQKLVVEPFLMVGLIAAIRRMLVMMLQAEATGVKIYDPGNKQMFESTMIEFGVMSLVIAVLVAAICLMRRNRAAPDEESSGA